MKDSADLLELATMLEKRAKMNRARAALATHDRTINAPKETQNADWCERMAAVCRRVATKKKAAPKKPKPTAEDETPAFQQFWADYPRRVGRANARAAWVKHRCENKLPEILAALEKAKASIDWKKDNGDFIPHPATWLNREGWEDDFTRPASMAPLFRDVPDQKDPPEWRDWLKSEGVEYREFWRATPGVRTKFNDRSKPA